MWRSSLTVLWVMSLAAEWGAAQVSLPAPALTGMTFPRVAGGVVYGMQGGGYPVRSEDNARTWAPVWVFTQGTAQRIASVAVEANDARVVYAATTLERGGVWKSTDGGRRFARANAGLPATGAAVEQLTVASNVGGTLYARVGNAIYRTTDGAATWQRRGTLPAGVSQVGIAEVAPARMYAMVRGGTMYRSDDEGATWHMVAPVPGDSNRVAQTIKIDPRDGNVVFVQSTEEAVENRCQAPGGGLWRSLDGGETWRMVWESGWCNISAEAFLDLQGAAVHLKVDDRPYRYCRSVDRGETFQCVTGLGIVAIDPRDLRLRKGRRSIRCWRFGVWRQRARGCRFGRRRQASDGFRCGRWRGQRGGIPADAGRDRVGDGDLRNGVHVDVGGDGERDVDGAGAAHGAGAGNRGGAVHLLAAGGSGKPALPGAGWGGNLYFHSLTGATIRRMDAAGNVTTVLGTGTRGDSPDETPAQVAQIDFLGGLAVDGSGTLYYAENTRNRVRTLRNGVIRTRRAG